MLRRLWTPRWHWLLIACLVVLLPLAGAYFGVLTAQQTHRQTTEVYDFVNGFQVAGMWRGMVMPATQTIAAGGTIASDACGTLKRITSAGAVTTDTVNSFSAPSTLTGSCLMMVCNVGASTITIDKNALTLLQGGADVALLANSCVTFGSEGTIWRQLTSAQTST